MLKHEGINLRNFQTKCHAKRMNSASTFIIENPTKYGQEHSFH